MEYNKQSLYKFINDNKILKIKPLRTESDAEIMKITKMKDQESTDDSFENKNKKIYIDKLPDGIYKVKDKGTGTLSSLESVNLSKHILCLNKQG